MSCRYYVRTCGKNQTRRKYRPIREREDQDALIPRPSSEGSPYNEVSLDTKLPLSHTLRL